MLIADALRRDYNILRHAADRIGETSHASIKRSHHRPRGIAAGHHVHRRRAVAGNAMAIRTDDRHPIGQRRQFGQRATKRDSRD